MVLLQLPTQTYQQLFTGMDYYEIVWVINGTGKLHVDMWERLIEKNMIFCLRPYQAHRFVGDASMEGFVFSFTGEFFNVGEYEFDNSIETSLQQLFSEYRWIPDAQP